MQGVRWSARGPPSAIKWAWHGSLCRSPVPALRYFTLDSTDHVSHAEQASMLCHYIAWQNRNGHDRRFREIVNRQRLPDAPLIRSPVPSVRLIGARAMAVMPARPARRPYRRGGRQLRSAG
jgi:hypothetical protein